MLPRKVLPFIIPIVFILVGCGGYFNGDKSYQETYYEALVWYNNIQESYLNHYDLADPATQGKLKDRIDPIFAQASAALDAWEIVVGEEDERAKADQWIAIKNLLLAELLASGVLED